MTEGVSCIGCERSVGVGSPRFPSRIRYGDGYLCDDCGTLLRDGGDGTESGEQKLELIRQFGLGLGGGRSGAMGGPV